MEQSCYRKISQSKILSQKNRNEILASNIINTLIFINKSLLNISQTKKENMKKKRVQVKFRRFLRTFMCVKISTIKMDISEEEIYETLFLKRS
jgi:hypothetical protein